MANTKMLRQILGIAAIKVQIQSIGMANTKMLIQMLYIADKKYKLLEWLILDAETNFRNCCYKSKKRNSWNGQY
jgi:hypothetical protein